MARVNIFRASEESDHLSDASTKSPTTESDKEPAGETDNESSASSGKKPAQAVKKKAGRPRFEEGVLQTAKPDYWKNHYHEKRTALIECPVCGHMVTKNNFGAHEKTMKCRLKGLEKYKSMTCGCLFLVHFNYAIFRSYLIVKIHLKMLPIL